MLLQELDAAKAELRQHRELRPEYEHLQMKFDIVDDELKL